MGSGAKGAAGENLHSPFTRFFGCGLLECSSIQNPPFTRWFLFFSPSEIDKRPFFAIFNLHHYGGAAMNLLNPIRAEDGGQTSEICSRCHQPCPKKKLLTPLVGERKLTCVYCYKRLKRSQRFFPLERLRSPKFQRDRPSALRWEKRHLWRIDPNKPLHNQPARPWWLREALGEEDGHPW